jgi:hypothetical protein
MISAPGWYEFLEKFYAQFNADANAIASLKPYRNAVSRYPQLISVVTPF